MSYSVVLRPEISTGGRSVLVRNINTRVVLVFLYAIPLFVLYIAVVDQRAGLRLFMLSAFITALTMAVSVHLLLASLKAGVVRISASGPLQFVPPIGFSRASLALGISFFFPPVAVLVVGAFGLPTLGTGSVRSAALPFVLAAIGAGLVGKELWGLRWPLGLRIDERGLRGVRGSVQLTLGWDQLVGAEAFGSRGPKLGITINSRGVVLVDSHFVGSDPVIVARVIEYYIKHPDRRGLLAEGAAAIREVEAAYR